jgi:hypothetical protein
MKRFTIYRTAIHCETYIVEAESAKEAFEQLYDGCYDPVGVEFVDWHGEYEIEHVEELDPLYRMVKDYKCDTTS